MSSEMSDSRKEGKKGTSLFIMGMKKLDFV
jgi:hypothetical protein